MDDLTISDLALESAAEERDSDSPCTGCADDGYATRVVKNITGAGETKTAWLIAVAVLVVIVVAYYYLVYKKKHDDKASFSTGYLSGGGCAARNVHHHHRQ